MQNDETKLIESSIKEIVLPKQNMESEQKWQTS